MSYKHKYLKYKEKYLNLRQKGGSNYQNFDNLHEVINFLSVKYCENMTGSEAWLIFGILFKDDKYHIDYGIGMGGAGSKILEKMSRHLLNSHKFRPFVKVDDVSENRKKIIELSLNSLSTFLSIEDAYMAGKFWLRNMKDCQCGKFFDLYANYYDSLSYEHFKKCLIKMSKSLAEAGFEKEDRCLILYPEILYANSKEYLGQTFSTLLESNYSSAKIEYLYIDSDIPITYRNDEIIINASYSVDFIKNLIKKYFLKDGKVVKAANSPLFERMFLDNILVEYKKNPEIVFNEESQLLTLKTVFDLDRDLTTNFNRLFSRFWLCENPTHNQVINKEFKCCKCYSFVCPGCTIINTNVERDNVCIMCSVKYTDEQLNEIIPN